MKSPITRKSSYFKLEMAKNNLGVSSFGGLPLIRKALEDFGLIKKITDEIYLKRSFKFGGYRDEKILEAIILLLASGGTNFSSWENLTADPGFQKLFGKCMSVDVLERYLQKVSVTFLDTDTKTGVVGYSTILECLHRHMIEIAYELAGRPEQLTLDTDASIHTSSHREAQFCYEMKRAYLPMSAYCPELRMVIAHEFRDGNISPQVGYDRLVRRCREYLPAVKSWRIRSDSAAYQVEMLSQWAVDGHEFFVTADQFQGMHDILEKHSAWESYFSGDVKTDQEMAEIAYVPKFSNQQELEDRRETIRFIGIRKPKSGQLAIGDSPYIYQVIITNTKEKDLNKIMKTHWERCGTVEHLHEELKNGCGMRRFPSKNFSVNAAWYSLGILTHNVIKMMQQHVLPDRFHKSEIRTIHNQFIRSAIWVKEKCGQIIIRCCKNHPMYRWYKTAQEKLEQIVCRLMLLNTA